MRLLDSHNVVIRKNKRSKCLIVHRDKLKPCFGEAGGTNETPEHPAVVQEADAAVADNGQTPSPVDNPVVVPATRNRVSAEWYHDADNTRPKRHAKQPAYLNDYHVSYVCRSIKAMSNRQIWQAKQEGCYCEACGRGFSKRSSLKRHLKSTKDTPDHNARANFQLAAWRPRGRPAGNDSRTVVKRPRKAEGAPDNPNFYASHEPPQQRLGTWLPKHETREPEQIEKLHMVRMLSVARKDENSGQRRLGWTQSRQPVQTRQQSNGHRRLTTPSRPPTRAMITSAYEAVTEMLKQPGPNTLASVLNVFQGRETNLKPGQARAACASSIASILLSVEVMSGKSVAGLQATDLTQWTMAVRDLLGLRPPAAGTVAEPGESASGDSSVGPVIAGRELPVNLSSETELTTTSLTMEIDEIDQANMQPTTEQLTDMDLFEESIFQQCQRISVELIGDITRTSDARGAEVVVRASDLKLGSSASLTMSEPLSEDLAAGRLIGSEPHTVSETKANADGIIETASGMEIQGSGFDEVVTMAADQSSERTMTDAQVISPMRVGAEVDETTLSSSAEHDHGREEFPALRVTLPPRRCALSNTPPFVGSGEHTTRELCLHVEVTELTIPVPPPVSAEIDHEVRRMATGTREATAHAKETIMNLRTEPNPEIVVGVSDNEPWQATQGRMPTNRVFVTPGQKKSVRTQPPETSPRLNTTGKPASSTSKFVEGTGRGTKGDVPSVNKKKEVRREGSLDNSTFASAIHAGQRTGDRMSTSKSVKELTGSARRIVAGSKAGEVDDGSKRSRDDGTRKPVEKVVEDGRTSDKRRGGTNPPSTMKSNKTVDSSKSTGKAECQKIARSSGTATHKPSSSKRDLTGSSSKTAPPSQEVQAAILNSSEPIKGSGASADQVTIEPRAPAGETPTIGASGIGSVAGLAGLYGQAPQGPGWMQPWSPYWMMPPPWWGPPPRSSSNNTLGGGWPGSPAMQQPRPPPS